MKADTSSREMDEKLNRSIGNIMATLGVASFFWFLLFIIVDFINNIALLQQ